MSLSGQELNYSSNNRFDISAAYSENFVGFSLATNVRNAADIEFNSDGSRMFILDSDFGSRSVLEYELSISYDVSTAVYSGSAEDFILNETTQPTAIDFNIDGTKMFVGSFSTFGNVYVHEYTLSVAFDVSTATYSGDSERLLVENGITGMTFNDDGTKLFLVHRFRSSVLEYTLAMAYDVSTATNAGANEEFSVFQEQPSPSEIAFNNDGTKMFIAGIVSQSITEYTLAVAYDVSSASYAGALQELNVENSESNPAGMTFNSDGTKLFFVGLFGANVYETSLITAYDLSTASYVFDSFFFINVINQESSPQGMVFNNDGTKVFVIGVSGRAVVEYILSTAFDISTAVYAGASEEFFVGFQDTAPIGIVFNNDGFKMFVLGRTDDSIIEYALSSSYDVSTAIYAGASEEFYVGNEESNPVGMAFNDDGTKMFVVGRSGQSVVEYDLSVAFDVSTASYTGASEEFSIAGEAPFARYMVFNNDGTKMFFPTSNTIVEYSLSAAYDVSTATYSGIDEELIVGGIPHALAFNNVGSKLFVLEFREGIREFTIGAGYQETNSNNGVIGSNIPPLVIDLFGDTFQDTDADDLLDIGPEVVINNVPVGLTPIMELSNNDTRVTLTFIGAAINHRDEDDVSDLTFTFFDAAFVSGNALAVTSSGAVAAFSSNVKIDFAENRGPGGVYRGLLNWSRGDLGVNGSSNITHWNDISTSRNSLVAAQGPELINNDINFNPSLSFDGSSEHMQVIGGIFGTDTYDDMFIFAVNKTKSLQVHSFFSENLAMGGKFSSQIPSINGQIEYTFETTFSNGVIATNWGASLGDYHLWTMASSVGLSTPSGRRKTLYRDGLIIAANDNQENGTGANNDFYLGGGPSSAFYDGNIAEIIIYNSVPTELEMSRVQSYLGIKYGITLDNSGGGTAGDYTDSDDNIVWDASMNTTYHNDVTGIGRDDASSLSQKQSKSVNVDDVLTIGLGTIATSNLENSNNFDEDNSFMVWGNDNGSTAFTAVINNSIDNSGRLDRVWKMVETGTIGNVRIAIPNTIDGFDGSQPVSLVVHHTDPGFPITDRIEVDMTDINNNYEVTFDFPSGTSFFTFANDDAQTLPIELLSFDAELIDEEGVKLTWVTSSEIDNDFFTLEKSINGNDWKVFEKISGAGDSNVRIEYEELDANPYSPITFYRLKQTDFDGAYTYSDVVYVETGLKPQIDVYPNPTSRFLTVKGIPINSNASQVSLVSITGTIIREFDIELSDTNNFILDLANVPTGIYLLQMSYIKERITKRIYIE